MKRKRKLPRKVWFHEHDGEVWFFDAFFSKKAARKALRNRATLGRRGRAVTLKKAGWSIVGPCVRS